MSKVSAKSESKSRISCRLYNGRNTFCLSGPNPVSGSVALTTIFAKIGVAKINSNLATAIRTVVILLIAWGIVFAQRGTSELFTISRKTLLFLVLSGIATGISWLFYFRALQVGKASLVAPIDKASLALVIIFSAMFLHEAITAKAIIGVALILAGTLVIIL